jgi:predicted RNA-binding protein YlxR (DUF448 family)
MPPAANSPDGELTGIEPDLETPILETDGGPSRAGKGSRDPHKLAPERRCIATMESRPQSEMIRFVLSPSGDVTPDLAARLPGRGAWVASTRAALETAVKKGAFSRAFKGKAKASSDLPDQVDELLVRRALDQLGLAKRAGDLILGFEQVREALRAARPGCVIEASDGAADGRGKLLALLLAAHGPSRDPGSVAGNDERAENQGLPPVVGCFSADELGMALGRERVIHACLKQGRFAQSWIGDLARLSGFRRVWLSFDDRARPGASPNDDAGRKIDDTQARVSGGDPPDTCAATDVLQPK